MKYEVVYGVRKGKKFETLQDAVIFAREKVKDISGGMVVAIWEEGLVIGVVSDDADSVTVHRLKNWPEDAVCAY